MVTADTLTATAARLLRTDSCDPSMSLGDSAGINGEDLLKQLKQCSQLHEVLLGTRPKASGWCSPLSVVLDRLLLSLLRVMRQRTDGFEESQEAMACLLDMYRCLGGDKDWSGGKWCYGQECLWIVKPVALSCGEGIRVVQGLGQVLAAVSGLRYKCVVQKYIEKPLLLRRRQKFDIRQWVLVTADSRGKSDRLRIWGFSECYLRLSAREYSTAVGSLGEGLIHLCNQSVQGSSSPQEHLEGRTHEESHTMMSQGEFDDYLRREKSCSFEDIILPQLQRVCVETISAAKDKLQVVGRGFEWLGVDLMVTEEMEVLLLEVNVSPDMMYSTPITARLVPAATADLFARVLEEEGNSDVDKIECPGMGMPCVKEDCVPMWKLWHTVELSAEELKLMREEKVTVSGVLRTGDDSAAEQDEGLLGAVEVVLGEGDGGWESSDSEDEM